MKSLKKWETEKSASHLGSKTRPDDLPSYLTQISHEIEMGPGIFSSSLFIHCQFWFWKLKYGVIYLSCINAVVNGIVVNTFFPIQFQFHSFQFKCKFHNSQISIISNSKSKSNSKSSSENFYYNSNSRNFKSVLNSNNDLLMSLSKLIIIVITRYTELSITSVSYSLLQDCSHHMASWLVIYKWLDEKKNINHFFNFTNFTSSNLSGTIPLQCCS